MGSKTMYLRPLKIRFSQDSIANIFGCSTQHSFIPIGETLDAILSGRCDVNSILSISVICKDDHWFTADNKRLWVFQEAEKRGRCREIPVVVREETFISDNKFTTTNNGASIEIRGNAGGSLWGSIKVRAKRSKRGVRIKKSMRKVKERPLESCESYSMTSASCSSTLNAKISFSQENQDIGNLPVHCEQNYVTESSDLMLEKPSEHSSLSADVAVSYEENVSIGIKERSTGETEHQLWSSEIKDIKRPNSMSGWPDVHGNMRKLRTRPLESSEFYSTTSASYSATFNTGTSFNLKNQDIGDRSVYLVPDSSDLILEKPSKHSPLLADVTESYEENFSIGVEKRTEQQLWSSEIRNIERPNSVSSKSNVHGNTLEVTIDFTQ
jgi:hypothetical protein